MPIEKHFIKQGIKRVQLETYLKNELSKAGYGGVDIRRVLTGTRVTVYVERPGMVIGKKGKSIKQLTDDLEQKFGLEKPQVEVVEIPKPELSGPIMAKHIAFALERGLNVRRIGQSMVRTIMGAGARGVEIVISGRIAGERSRRMRFYEGYLSKAGEPAHKLVSRGEAVAKLKPGIVGIKVIIMPPDVPLPGEIKIAESSGAEEQPVVEKVGETKVEETVKEEEQPVAEKVKEANVKETAEAEGQSAAETARGAEVEKAPKKGVDDGDA